MFHEVCGVDETKRVRQRAAERSERAMALACARDARPAAWRSSSGSRSSSAETRGEPTGDGSFGSASIGLSIMEASPGAPNNSQNCKRCGPAVLGRCENPSAGCGRAGAGWCGKCFAVFCSFWPDSDPPDSRWLALAAWPVRRSHGDITTSLTLAPKDTRASAEASPSTAPSHIRRFSSLHGATPATQLLSTGSSAVMITAAGSGYRR